LLVDYSTAVNYFYSVKFTRLLAAAAGNARLFANSACFAPRIRVPAADYYLIFHNRQKLNYISRANINAYAAAYAKTFVYICYAIAHSNRIKRAGSSAVAKPYA